MQTKKIAEAELNAVKHKVDENISCFRYKFPCITKTQLYTPNLQNDPGWTGSFWTGMVVLAYIMTQDETYAAYLDGYYSVYENRLKNQVNDHDVGFLYQLYAVNLYKMTGQKRYWDLSILAAKTLMCRYNPRGPYIRAWGSLLTDYRRGKLIIDCLMNLPLLYCAARMDSQPDFHDAAAAHAATTLRNIRPDHSTYHTYDYDPITGSPIKGENEGGFSDESCWSRGQSWGIYGYYLSWLHTGNSTFLNAAIQLAMYFIDHLPADVVPEWDFKLPPSAPTGKDASAAAIAASALYDLSNVVEEKTAQCFRKVADNLLSALIKEYSCAQDEQGEILLKRCYCGGPIIDGRRTVYQCGTIFGDYFYMEALMKCCGYSLNMWDL